MNNMDTINHNPGPSRRTETYGDFDDDMNNQENNNQLMMMNNMPHKQPFNIRNVSNELNIGQNGKPRFNQFNKGNQGNNKFMNNSNQFGFNNRGPPNQQHRNKMIPRVQRQSNMNFGPF